MSGQFKGALPWALLTLALVLLAASYVLAFAGGTSKGLGAGVFIVAIAVVFGATGVMIASRHSFNPIGWLFLVASVSAGVGNVAGSYAEFYVATGNGPRTLAGAAAQYGELSWMPFILLPSTFLLALFPNGHLLSRRWRPVAWCSAIGMASGFVVEGMKVGPVGDHPQLTNPFGVDSPVLSPLDGLSLLLIGIGMIGSSISLIVRFRRSHGEQRQQIKWLALAGIVAATTISIATPAYEVLGEDLANALMMTAVMGLPVAAAVAILRYRLYDIDVVINRALVYGALTATLAGTYLISVLLLQLVLESLTQGSGLAVAASTLAAAAVVRPARARIQGIVDRRFFRRKYDAAQTLDSFTGRLRDQVDLATVQCDLRAVVAQTLQPSHVSLWIPANTREDR